MNYFKLAYTTPDVLVKIKEAEKRGDFNAHLDPVDYGSSLPVDEKFPYIPTGALKFRQALIRAFIIKPFMWIVNRFIFRTRMIVLETQSYNSKAISFYMKNGFEIIGFERYAYSNNGPKEHNMRIEMGRMI